MKLVLLFFCAMLLHGVVRSQTCQTLNAIGGTVFIDVNNNGIKDAEDTTGVSGVQVNAINNGGVVAGTATTNATGQYVLSTVNAASGALTIQFITSTLPMGYVVGKNGTDGRTDVQFTTAPDCSVDLSVISTAVAASACSSNPDVVATLFQAGSASSSNVLLKFPYNNSGTTPAPSSLSSPGTTLGATWGLAYQANSNKLFSAAVMRRHTAFGIGGTGAIYMTDATANTSSLYLNLNTAPFSNAPLNINLGTDQHQNSNLINDVIVGANNPFDAVGKVSFGDLDFSTDGKYLYAVNLFQRTIIKIFTDNPAKVGSAITASDVTVFNVPDPGCTGGTYRPWGLKYYNNKLYIGIVCDGGSGGVGAGTNQTAFVYEMNPTTGVSTQVLSFPLTYKKGLANTAQTLPNDGRWNNWISSWISCSPAPGDFGVMAYPQPILSDIEIDVNGDMIVAFIDRFGMQAATLSPDPNGALAPQRDCTPNWFQYSIIASGDILRAGKCSGTTWTIENNASVCSNTPTAGENNGEGPGTVPNNGEFYSGDVFAVHQETALGSLALIPGKGEVIASAYDPLNYYSNGIIKLNNTTGVKSSSYEIFAGTSSSPFGKSNSLGDIEVLCDVNIAPLSLQIGNRIWLDENGDGSQSPTEPGISGVTVELYKNGVLIARTTTNANGEYYFTSAAAGNATWFGTGADTEVLANTAYEIRIPVAQMPINSYILTSTNSTQYAGNDQIDNDAALSMSGTDAVVSVTTGSAGNSNHTFDVGFRPVLLSLATNFNFTVTNINGSISCSWKGVHENNIKWYVVEKSIDGVNYNAVHRVLPNRTDNLYTIVDNQPLQNNTYYRLTVVYENGSNVWSDSKLVSLIQSNMVSIFPNPTSNVCNIKIPEY
jgi:hypothetical protein